MADFAKQTRDDDTAGYCIFCEQSPHSSVIPFIRVECECHMYQCHLDCKILNSTTVSRNCTMCYHSFQNDVLQDFLDFRPTIFEEILSDKEKKEVVAIYYLKKQNKVDVACALYQEIVNSYRKELANGSFYKEYHAVSCAASLALSDGMLGRYEKSLALLLELEAADKGNLLQEDPSLDLSIMAGMKNAYKGLDRWEEAVPYLDKMGMFFRSRCLFAKSLEAYNEILQYKEGTRGGGELFEDTIAVATALKLCFVAVQNGQANTALEWLRRLDSAKNLRKMNSDPQFEFAVSQAYGAVYTECLGRDQEALSHVNKAYSMAFSSQNDFEIEAKLSATHNLSVTHSRLGNHEKAMELAREAFTIAAGEFGTAHHRSIFLQSELEAREIAAQGEQTTTVAELTGLPIKPDRNGTRVQILSFQTRKKKYVVLNDQGEQLLIKPSNIIFDRGTRVFLHSLEEALQEHNGKEGQVQSHNTDNGNVEVRLEGTAPWSHVHSIHVSPDNILATHQSNLTMEQVKTMSQWLTASNLASEDARH